MTIPTKHTAPGTAILINENFRGFNGEIFDSASSGYLPGNGYRPYNPKAGNFLCRDSLSPFGPAGENRYQYCHLDPINNADPTGHLSWQAGVGIGLGVLGLLLSVFTFGFSLALVAGGAVVAGALGVTSGVLGLASAATGIASSALEGSDPATSAALRWASFGLGIGSVVTGMLGPVPRISGRFLKPSTLYRGDLRRLSDITRAGGFKGLGKNTSITTHLSGRNAAYSSSPLEKSAYVSLTGSRSVATNFAAQRMASEGATAGYVYQINTSGVKVVKPMQNGFSRSNKDLFARSRMHQEFLSRKVPPGNITLIDTLGL